MNWTTEQNKAITTSGTNVIVSAGAGSGKTAVLTERVIRKLLNGTHINELLLLTFTNNAAAEMKTRIKKEILKYPEIIEESKIVDNADITTFDSFVLALVKKYHYYLNLSSDLSITDSSIINKKKKDYINEIFEELYEKSESNFLELVLNFGTKNDKLLKKTILELDSKIDLLTNKEEYLKNYVENYYDINNTEFLFNELEQNIFKKIDTIKSLLSNLSYEVNEDYYEKIYNTLLPLFNAKNYEELRTILNTMPSLPRISGSTEIGKYYKDKISKIIKTLKNDFLYSKSALINNFINTKKYATIIIQIISELTKRINIFKNKNNAYEFNDISKMAIKLIKEYDDVKNYLKYHYKEIMIDEYQDTSDVQEEFVNLISNNNVYMVGDIKQSIYRFRNANPNIFKIKYDKYKNNDNGIKIDLNENFRSRCEVLDSINQIFNHIMDINIGNANYSKEHQLIYGNKSFIQEGNNNYNNYLEIYNYNQEDTTNTEEEIEAFIIANDIKEKIKNKYLVFDKVLRPCTYKDFCILMDRTTSFDTYKKIFDYLLIPLNIYKDDNILINEEVLIINNIIALILNIKNGILDNQTNFYFASIARSYLYKLPDQEIYDNITNHQVTTTEIYQICKDISYKIDYLSNKDILNIIIDKFNFYDKMITIGNTLHRTIILNNLLDKFNELNKVGINIYGINDYLNSLINDNESIKIPGIINDSDSVTITNIHKSKGLEYKICYYSGLHKNFNTMDAKKRVIWDNNLGLIIPNYDAGFIPTFVNTLYKEKYNIDEISEKLRLFYVALTRAKEKMIIVTSLKEDNLEIFDENELVDYLTRSSYKSFRDILNSCYKYIEKFIVNKSLPKINPNYKFQKEISISKIEKGSSLTVNELDYNADIINETHYSKSNSAIYSKEEISNLNLGTKMHYILETLDFNNPNLTIYNNIELEIINGLLESHLLSNINNANIYKEYEFIYEKDNTTKHGIIDLMLEYNDHIDIIDYKLKNTTDSAYLKQLNGYKEYIEYKTNKKVNIYLYSLIDKEIKDLN